MSGDEFQVVIDLPSGWGVENATRAAVEIQRQFNQVPDSGEIKVRARKVRPGSTRLESVVDWAERHQNEHPNHGINCACANEMVRRIRIASRVEGATTENVGSEAPEWDAQHRVDYIISRAVQNRY